MADQVSEDQMKALQEKIKNMSPEELKEFQKKQCIFCQIISGKVQSKKIYEDDHTIAVLDINPSNPGHILLMTKEHYSIMPQIPQDEIAHVFMVAKSLSNSLLRGLDAQGTNIIVANGVAAGQRAQHFMAHVIPRKDNDGVNFVLPQKSIEQSELDSIADKISSSLSGEEKPAPKPQNLQPIAKPAPSLIPSPKSSSNPKSKLAQETSKNSQTFEESEEKDEVPDKKDEPKTQPSNSDINLDDIAKILGVKGGK